MAFSIRPVDYYYVSVQDRPGAAWRLLALLAEQGIDLLAFTAVPSGPDSAILTLCPKDGAKLRSVAKNAGIALSGPQHALLVSGDDALGALAVVHERLARADVNVYSSSGLADGQGSFSYLIYVRPERFDLAVSALQDAVAAL
ncbi:MAG: hypothetical protein IPM29_20795 [Planctomycetes bacterium]|nr:hypothetical protein [Planctomycetota bacterium]